MKKSVSPSPSPISNIHLPVQRQKRSCDRCHANKERCTWSDERHDKDVCERCLRLGKTCEVNRPTAKIGRKRASPAGNRMLLRRWTSGSASPWTSPESQGRSTPSPPASPPGYTSTQLIPSIVSYSRHRNTLNYTIPPKIAVLSELNQAEIHFLGAVMHKGIQVDKYLIGPSFRERHLQSFVNHLSTEMPHVKDAFIACASRLTAGEQEQQASDSQSVGYRRAAAAIASLRTANFHSDSDLSMLLILGVAIVTFILHHSGCLPVCQFVLGLVNSMYEKDQALLKRLSNDGAAFLLCLVGTELEECIVSSQLPTIRIEPGTFDQLVDRFTGVSAPIFAHYYDICHLSQQFKQLRYSKCDYSDASLEEIRCHLQRALEDWQPSVSRSRLEENLSPNEIITIMGQARILRLTGLIILHRLRHPYGTRDDEAIAMSTSILEELDTITEMTGRTVPFCDIPHLVACFELQDDAARREALQMTHKLINFSQYCCKEQQASVVAFWNARDKANRDSLFWIDVNSCII